MNDDFPSKLKEFLKKEIGEDTHFLLVVVSEEGETFHIGYGCEKCMSETLIGISQELAEYPHVADVEKFIDEVEDER